MNIFMLLFKNYWNIQFIKICFRFKNGLSNCIVATDILDEGVNIPKCSLIIRYDLPMDVRTYIQSKGRARYVHSQYILLLDKGNLRFKSRYNEFKKIEQYLQEVSYSYFY